MPLGGQRARALPVKPEVALLRVVRRLFGLTKLLSLRLDYRDLRPNSVCCIGINQALVQRYALVFVD